METYSLIITIIMGMEGPQESIPEPKTREEIVSMLRDVGIDGSGVREEIGKYVTAQEQLANPSENPFWREDVATHMAEVYFDGGYEDYGLESLDEMIETLSRPVEETDILLRHHPLDDLYNKIEEARKKMLNKMRERNVDDGK